MADPQPLRYPDVQKETVLGDVGVRVPHLLALKPGEVFVTFLVAGVGQLRCVQDAGPGLGGYGLAEAQGPDGWLGEGDAREDVDLTAKHVLTEPAH